MNEPNVTVAILTSPEIKFELYGSYKVEGSNNIFNGKYSVKLDSDKIVVKNESESYSFDKSVLFVPQEYESDSFLLRDVIIGIQFHWEQKENQRFNGSLKLIKEKENIIAVNSIPSENYLTSVISSEMSATSSIEFLKAHSIISRSWLFAQIQKSKKLQESENNYKSISETEDEYIRWYDREDHTLFDVCADDHCQRYQGITKQHAHNAHTAVSDTRGLILEYNDEICDARFSKSCGGISESFSNVWEPIEHPYLTKVVDYKFQPDNYNLDLSIEKNADKWITNSPPAFCNTQDERILSQVLNDYDLETKDFYRWKVEYMQKEISELINKKSGFDFGEIKDIIPVLRGDSGRLIKVKIVGTKMTKIIGKELEIRRILSKSHLYSSAFVVSKSDFQNEIPNKFILTGAGWGHGVGLCQIGAAVMSDMGYNFDEILLHYFSGAKIKKVY
jgi:stage II sporulation protein D